jgi:hypothetical protein
VESSRKRKLLGFYIAAFVLLGLVGASVALYRPLRLRYAIYRVQRNLVYKQQRCPGESIQADKWLMECAEAACRGNRPAMRVVVDHPDAYMPPPGAYLLGGPAVTHHAARAQPELFLEFLDQKSDKQVLEILLLDHNRGYDVLFRDVGRRSRTWELICLVAEGVDKDAPRVVGAMVEDLETTCLSGEAEDHRLAEQTLVFLRSRFARELAEARKDGK